MQSENMKIYDQEGKEVATVSRDASGATRLIVVPGISSQTHEDVQNILMGAGNTHGDDYPDRLRELSVKKGYTFESDEEVEVRLEKNVDYIYESNLIEEVREIDRKTIDERYRKNEHFGCVGAWVLAQERGNSQEPLTGEDTLKMQKLLTDEQVLFGHHLPQHLRGNIRQEKDWVSVGWRVIPPPTPEQYHKFFEDLNTGIKALNPVDTESIVRFSAKMHLKYELMHPFGDGNGRTGRNIANYVFQYFRMPILVFTNVDKSKYYYGFNTDGPDDSHLMEEYFLAKYQEQNPDLFQS